MNDKLTFWKKLKISITDFDRYQDLAAEKIGKTIIYIVIMMLIFSFVIAGLYTYKCVTILGSVRKYIENNIETIAFENGKLSIVPNNKEKEIKLLFENTNSTMQLIINTNINNEQEKNDKIEEIKSSENGILILNDRILIKNSLTMAPQEYQYESYAEQLNITNLDKQTILNYLSDESMMPIIMASIVSIFCYMFMIYFSSVLVDILVFSAMGYIFTIIARVKIKYSAVYNIAAYSVTLPVILNLIYFIVNFFTGFTIKYFEIMYTAVASIYIITAILMIKSDIIKKQIELAKIIEEQDKVREELKRREEEKEQEERERQKKEEEKKRKQKEKDDQKDEPEEEKKKTKKKKENGPDINIGKEPEGNNV